MGKISIHGDGSSLTVSCTQGTSDTTCAAGRLDLKSLVVGVTSDKSLRIVWNKLYQMSWTLCNAFTARLTLLLINYSNSVYNVNSPKLTYRFTRSISCTSVCTRLRSTVRIILSQLAVSRSHIFVHIFCLLTVPCALDKCHILCIFSVFHAHDLTDLCRYSFSSDGTCRWGHLTFCNGCCQSVTSRISTSSAVISREELPYCYFFLIYFYLKFFSCDTQKDTYHNTYACDNCHSYQYSCHTAPSLYQS